MKPEDSIVAPKIAAWVATLMCVLFTARYAAVHARKSPQLFTVLSLFALTWALLLPYYGNIARSELFPAFGSFLLVFSGTLLQQEAQRRQPNAAVQVGRMERLALWSFGLLAAPSVVSLPLPNGGNLGISVQRVELMVATFLTVLGYLSILQGVDLLCGRRRAHYLLALFVVYIALELVFAIEAYPMMGGNDPVPAPDPNYWRTPPDMPMDEYFLYGFSVMKCAFTFLFVCFVADEAMDPIERQRPLLGKLLDLVERN